jgi:dihydropteroate synthase
MSRVEEHTLRAPPSDDSVRWRLRNRELELRTPQIAVICNVTPDSFSDGGEHFSVDLALRMAELALREGASIIDIGGESTRPGAVVVSARDELARVIPVIRAVVDRLPELAITIDTSKSVVAREALLAGAHGINDVSAGRLDANMFAVAAEFDAGLILMHSRGGVTDMASYTHATYGTDVVGDVCAELTGQVTHAIAAGVARESLVLDPGIGFSKTTEQSLCVLRELERIVALGFPVMIGASRKRIIGDLTGAALPSRRATGGAVIHAFAAVRGARVIRTHDVTATREALAVALALQ